MIKFEHADVVGWEHAIRGMRNPLNSWMKSDSGDVILDCNENIEVAEYITDDVGYIVGPNDLNLMKRLRNAGTDHRKFMRMLVVYVDITAPLYWWKEFDTYKVGTVANSCSTMHTIHKKEFTLGDFSCDFLIDEGYIDSDEHGFGYSPNITNSFAILRDEIIPTLNYYRECYNKARKDENKKLYWWQMIQLLPTSYNQKRTVMLNYEVLANIYKSRKDHKLVEWHGFCDWIRELPYSELITGEAPFPTDDEIQRFYENAKLINDQIDTWRYNFKWSNVIDLLDSKRHIIYSFNFKVVSIESALETIRNSVEEQKYGVQA